MGSKRIEHVPIEKIRVVNPRSRNRKTFAGIVGSIERVGLKKPITVFRRGKEADGTEYDLVCGQGRMEGVAALGGRNIPSIVTDASLSQRYLMSLVENVARKRPPQSDLVCEVRRLKKDGFKNIVIAERLGLGKSYIDGIVRLLRQGEDRLVEQVVAETVPLAVAITIATEPDGEIQKALNDAYERGELRGAKLVAVQRMLARRSAAQRKSAAPTRSKKRITGKDLIREYEIQTFRQRDLVRRAGVVGEQLSLLTAAFRTLMRDEQFVALLKQEGLDTIPEALYRPTGREAGNGNIRKNRIS